MKRILLILLIIFAEITSAFGNNIFSYSKDRKYYLPIFDEVFTENLSKCEKSYIDNWEGTYRYEIMGFDKQDRCMYKVQHNPWLEVNENRWIDFKGCRFTKTQLFELTNEMKNFNPKLNTYHLGRYKVTSTKLDYMLLNYDYYGTCRNFKR